MKLNQSTLKPVFFFFLFTVILNLDAATVTWLGGSGSWSTPSYWDTGTVPTQNDDVIIPSGQAKVYQNNVAYAKSITVQSAGWLWIYHNGELYISGASNKAGLHNQGYVRIYGSLFIDDISSSNGIPEHSGFYNDKSCYISASGYLEITNTDASGLHCTVNTNYFQNVGEIFMDNIGKHCIRNWGDFRNTGLIELEASTNYPNYGILNHGLVRNWPGGEIIIDGGGAAAFGNNYISGYNTKLLNWGSIELHNSTQIGLSNSGQVSNYSAGSIHAQNSGINGIYNITGGSMTNEGNMVSLFSGLYGILNFGSLTNNGLMSSQVSSVGLKIEENANLINTGFIDVYNANINMQLIGTLTNEASGIMIFDDKINLYNEAVLENKGYLDSRSVNAHYISTGTGAILYNAGVIIDVYDAFPNTVYNEQVVIKPINDPLKVGVPHQDALQVDNFNNVTINSWKTAQSGGTSAGIYNSNTNEFTPNSNAAGLNTLYISVTMNATGMSRNCIIKLNGGVLGFKGNDDLPQFGLGNPSITKSELSNTLSEAVSIYPNPTSGSINLHSSLFEQNLTQIFVYNALGQIVMQKEISGGISQSLEIPGEQANGIYMIQCLQEGKPVAVNRIQLQR